ncbi:tyrosine-protein kinase receptor TYRO3-like [Tigriopus californicus]|uniref:tyrosine-protein kinase receptor TYRO3-like n=1 Tax=Tigriopus californicus TaxID=6832 RepID=UPI0027DA9CD5|nr:tyrosine-protein kinase receptor TYRO3-like [Tigriopus californicus]
MNDLGETPKIQVKAANEAGTSTLLSNTYFQRLKASSNVCNTHSVPSSPSPFSKRSSPEVRTKRSQRTSVTSTLSEIQIQINDRREVKFPNRFHKRLWRWIKSKTRRKTGSSCHLVVETHAKRKHCCTEKFPAEISLQVLEEKRLSIGGQRVPYCARGSWADISINSGVYGDRRLSGSKCLVPPSTQMSTSRDLSMESGYQSHSSLSSPGTPRSLSARRRSSRGITAMKLSNNKSFSVDTGSSPPYYMSKERTFKNWRSEDHGSELPSQATSQAATTSIGVATAAASLSSVQKAMERRKQFSRLNNVFHEVVEDDGSSGSDSPYYMSKERTFKNWRSEDHGSELPSQATSQAATTSIGVATAAASLGSVQKAMERRKQFSRLNNVFHEVVEDDGSSGSDSPDCTFEAVKQSLGEWQIPHDEITFGKKIVGGGRFGHDVFTGKWHGDVVIHSFRTNASQEIRNYLSNIKTLTQIRHENIVLYMGASVVQDQMYNIVTNPVKAESLHSYLSSLNSPMDVEKTLSIAKQLSNAMGYLHAKNIIHGRISSRNVFLETKVQLSLLDYAVGQPNTVYSSPKVLTHPNTVEPEVFNGSEKADDIFAFGTLLFELFSCQLPLRCEQENVRAAKIRAGNLPESLVHVHCTDRLKRLIQKCWDYDEKRRPSFAQMAPHFSPGSGILRRHSSSEPRLDQMGKTTGRDTTGGPAKNTCTSIPMCVGVSPPREQEEQKEEEQEDREDPAPSFKS